MEFINIELLNEKLDEIKKDFHSKKPFKYTMLEGIFKPEAAELIYNAYPKIGDSNWNNTTYLDQKNKFVKTEFEKNSILDKVFNELNSEEYCCWLSKVSEIDELMGDPELFGAGLHQSIKGAFLNVHVDYNIHPKTKYHRRLNCILFMNKDWKDEYEGHTEFWDLTANEMKYMGRFAPTFNRMVMFETNEISFHGHPKKLNTPDGINRKSIAVYYYTKDRNDIISAPEHNTIYVNTEGVSGSVKRINSGIKAFLERINKN
ncbi:MAG: hypothetical protein RJA07_1606 [Bacteroidota bacterium]|jgi:Rps23 Pro-64 3,4-dihydroxylase Tpa1-like proline 4-hydroxylase